MVLCIFFQAKNIKKQKCQFFDRKKSLERKKAKNARFWLKKWCKKT